jgi:hypothetical protein
MADKKEEKKEPEVKLTKDELILLQNLLFHSRWTGQEWEQVIKPLINKLALLVDLENKKVL